MPEVSGQNPILSVYWKSIQDITKQYAFYMPNIIAGNQESQPGLRASIDRPQSIHNRINT